MNAVDDGHSVVIRVRNINRPVVRIKGERLRRVAHGSGGPGLIAPGGVSAVTMSAIDHRHGVVILVHDINGVGDLIDRDLLRGSAHCRGRLRL